MSEITQPPPEIQTQDTNARVSRLNAASDQSASNKQSAEQQAGKQAAESEVEKQVSHHDPAVTLASTLAKLDSGSYFTANTNGHDPEGRPIIVSELGTYVVEAGQKYAEDLKNIRSDVDLNIRVVTVDKEIKAEIIGPPTVSTPAPTAIPVELTLTEIAVNPGQSSSSTPVSKETPLIDVVSQYQATTLYKAERIAREIGDKLDNLPLPTTSPNYTVYGPTSIENDKAANLGPRNFSPTVSIQEVTSLNNTPATSTPIAATQGSLERILGKNINVEVIKTIPKTPIPLPPGLPEAVIKEISALTPLDYIQKGQNLNINIAAIAVPDSNKTPSQSPQPTPLKVETTAIASTAQPTQPETQIPPKVPISTDSVSVNTPGTQTALKDTVISGIIIDGANRPSANTVISPYNQKNSPQNFEARPEQADLVKNTYYLATPTTVLKLQSNTPLVPGTIVSFTVTPDNQTPTNLRDARPKPELNAVAVTPNTPQTSPTNQVAPEQVVGSLPQLQFEKIEQFVPQKLDHLPDDWASISMALAALTSTASTSAAAIMSSRIPNLQNPEQITSSMFFFLSALKAVHPARTWLGPDVSDKLKQLGAAKAIDHINGDMTRISRLGSDSPPGEWRPLLIPFQNGPEISAVPMLTRQILDDDQKNKNQNEEPTDENEIKVKATRFILELKFSQFGMVLVDGLLKENRLDIILKSANDIPFAVKMKLSKRYNDALNNNGFIGELVVIDNSPSEVSVRKMLETLTHNTTYEKKI